ncbi:T9SS type A sorting domain-containing protein [Candidatus Falkowbacteria bacterium]|jgi:hypothetical protein|nr:T9SS type A sorting domain-containing protein [Bacteroidales bacterium]MDD4175693.1 T9SS type A sorting domain-containing protein [Bacteroidales bacterium]MDD4742833.1 T9SS type A sorting domain-containing protein [Bacteroidales bacterium]NCU35909.1 T9SS type A sorting domain-containing protein [Candidatus Falkowbacteria bacterium]
MKNFYFIAIAMACAAFSFQAQAQQVVASSGGLFEGENISLSFTVGEPVTETFTGGNVILTQGFQQPYSFYLQQILNIPMGWSGISSYLNPLNKGVEAIFTNHQNDLIILASMEGFYYPALSINTIGNWNIETGYQIKAETDFELTITGSKIQNPQIEFDQGWNILPVLSACDVEVESLFAEFESLQIVKEVAGTHLYWPAYGINTLGNLAPGKAYFVAVADMGTVTFPICTKSAPNKQPFQKAVNTTPWNDLHYTASSHTVAFPAKVLAVSGILPGDVIGAFTPDGLCAGRMEIANTNSNMAVTVFANDEITPANDGFENGEMLQLKVYRPEQDQEFALEVAFDPSLPNMGQFTPYGLSAVQSLKLQPLEISENPAIKFEVYPNPSHGVFNLSMNVWPENLQVQITDMRGSIIKDLRPGAQNAGSVFSINLSGNPKGVYFLKLIDEGIVGMKKVVVQ